MSSFDGGGRLRILSRLATEAGSPALAAEADSLAERVAEGRFYVVCVGQFKRGKSALVNALVGESVLPTGVVPITAAVTVVRYGERLAARVRFLAGDWQECDPHALSSYVSEEQNPGNEKGITGVEVFVSSPLLESGMCLVDTPGLGSISAASTAATRAFVPHIDAALVVLGADPPISGEELALVQEVAGEVDDLIFILNKADRQPDDDRAEAIRFTERVFGERLGRPVGPVLQVSATDRLAGTGPPRDWDALVDRLVSLAEQSGADLVRSAATRGVTDLIERLLRELDEQHAALLRPIEESEARVEALRRAVADGERSLEELAHRLTAVQEGLSRRFTEERDRFFHRVLPDALRDLHGTIGVERATGAALRQRAIGHAIEVANRWLRRWRQEQEPQAEALYREATERFVELVNQFQERLAAVPGLERLPRLTPEAGFKAKSRFHPTEMLAVVPASVGKWILDLVVVRARRLRAIERDAGRYLERLLEVNSARIKNDFVDRVVESRRLLERELRSLLRELSASAERALEHARQAQAAGAAPVKAKLDWIWALRAQGEALRRERG
ncbi:MAG: dynamin family protein [Candidatus Rokubacteria bacterium]|nr:dynamin family protein [Candidatus Rokubacteria bacterium]